MLAIRNDHELNKLLGTLAIFAQTGVVPNIPKQILPGGKGKKGGKQCKDVDEDDDMEME